MNTVTVFLVSSVFFFVFICLIMSYANTPLRERPQPKGHN